MSAALKLGEEDAAAASRLREELQRLQAALKSFQEKVPCYITRINDELSQRLAYLPVLPELWKGQRWPQLSPYSTVMATL